MKEIDKKSAHTPGPWRQYAPTIDGTSEETYRRIRGGDGCVTYGTGFELTGYISEADARLMAAAPDLLVACKRLIQCISDGTTQVYEQEPDDGQSSMTACEMIEAAIAKATQQLIIDDDDE